MDIRLLCKRGRAAVPQLALFVCVAVGVFFLGATKPVRLTELKLLDYAFQVRGPGPIHEDIVLISIGDEDVESLGRWPWPRKYHADLITILTELGVKTIGYDVLFTRSDTSDAHSDQCLVDAVSGAETVVLPMAFGADGCGDEGHLLPMPALRNASSGIGFVNIEVDEDGITRSVALSKNNRLSLSLALAAGHLDAEVEPGPDGKCVRLHKKDGTTVDIPLDRRGLMGVNYPGVTRDWPWLHFVQIILAYVQQQQGEEPVIDPAGLKGKVVLVGSTQSGMPDIVESPFGEPVYGVEMHAAALNSILLGNFVRSAPAWLGIGIYFLFALAAFMSVCVFRPLMGGLVDLLLIAILAGGSFVLFTWFNYRLDPLRPIMGVGAAYLSNVVYYYLVVARRAKVVRNAFQHYVSPDVVSMLVRDPERLVLGGEVRDITILFCDIRGFTSLSETVGPDELGEFLNTYFSMVTSCIFDAQGSLDKFIGDGCMALFGAPLDLENHGAAACRAATGLVRTLRETGLRAPGGEDEVRIGVGLHSGPVKVGNFGSMDRFDYTAIGENVNLASRLEGLTKHYGVETLVSRMTRDMAGEEFLFRRLDSVRVKGSAKPVEIFEMAGEASSASRAMKSLFSDFETACELYLNRRFTEARTEFRRILEQHPGDGPSAVFAARAEGFEQNPPPEDWDGTFAHYSK